MNRHAPYLHIRPLEPSEAGAAAALLGRGMADNPINIAVYGGEEAHRARTHERLMRVLLSGSPSMRVEVAEQNGLLVAVAVSTPPGGCQPRDADRIRLLGRAMTFGPRVATRLLSWSGAWAAQDIPEPHVHLGPVSVDRHLRGQGIGTVLMLRHVAGLDSVGVAGYLETDRPEAVAFYRRHGYAVIDRRQILGVPNWFLRRPPG
ncbi:MULTISPECIES: GNAT family N-acetyltransferase [Microbacterium]|uniref:GNAT family N-acetyltransferase n=1 Tax=Microbacterium TaxID=33882 RepID=UPI000D65B74C|nr:MULTISPECIES: GNAT family N-acetyltransferase [Microbacterium]